MDKKESPCFNMPMKKKSVQIVLVSDNHGSREPLEYVRRVHADADSFIHCGDVELPTYLVDGFAVVQGNNDNYQQFPARRIVELGEHRIYVCHGHRDMFFGHFDMLSEKPLYFSFMSSTAFPFFISSSVRFPISGTSFLRLATLPS